MDWSNYQQTFFDFIENGKGSCVLIAVAGSGKTTVLVEGARRMPVDRLVQFLAFNKHIAEELSARLPPYRRASTFNSLGFRALLKFLDTRSIKLESNKVMGIITEMLPILERRIYAGPVRKLVSLAKAHGLLPRGVAGTALMLDTEQNWVELIERYDIEFDKGGDPLQGIEYARLALARSITMSDRLIDFDDQLYLPVVWQAPFTKVDDLLTDESQDINPVQLAMMRMMLKPEGRLYAVGDPAQSIYSWRGGDSEAINRIKTEFSAIELPLSISYRCPQLVVQEARRYVSHIEPSPTAIAGNVETLSSFTPATFDPKDVVLCRNNNPLVGLAFDLMKCGVPCRILGREIGQGLVRLIDKMDATDIDDLDYKLDQYEAREILKLQAKGKEEQAAALEDRCMSIRVFAHRLPETKRTIDELVGLITRLFDDNPAGLLTLSTVHKAKGKEWPRVFILDRHLMPSRWARQEWQQIEERNISYVAITRTQEKLFYIDSKGFTDEHSSR